MPGEREPSRDNLVERLRSRASAHAMFADPAGDIFTEAAGEIERLRAELRTTYDWLSAFEGDQTVTIPVNDLDAVRWRIRSTIEGGTDAR